VSGHHCHAIGCDTPTKPTLLMCGRHWAMVPTALRFEVIKHYRRGQCDDKRPSREWALAATRARLAVAEVEGRAEAVKWLRGVLAIRESKTTTTDSQPMKGDRP
jgi:hypothetical protein